MEKVITDGSICTELCKGRKEIVSDLSLYTSKEVTEWIGSGTENNRKYIFCSTSKFASKGLHHHSLKMWIYYKNPNLGQNSNFGEKWYFSSKVKFLIPYHMGFPDYIKCKYTIVVITYRDVSLFCCLSYLNESVLHKIRNATEEQIRNPKWLADYWTATGESHRMVPFLDFFKTARFGMETYK